MMPGLPLRLGTGSSAVIVHSAGSGSSRGQTLPRTSPRSPSTSTRSFRRYQVSASHSKSTSSRMRSSAAHDWIWIFRRLPCRSIV